MGILNQNLYQKTYEVYFFHFYKLQQGHLYQSHLLVQVDIKYQLYGVAALQ